MTYMDGIETSSDDTKDSETRSPGDGKIVVGRSSIDNVDFYASITIDELLFFNEKLGDQDIIDIKDTA